MSFLVCASRFIVGTLLLSIVTAPPVWADNDRDRPACHELTLFVRAGCPHCAAAKTFLPELKERFPGLTIRVRDIRRDPAALEAFASVIREGRIQRPGVPTFWVCGHAIVGFDASGTTGQLITDLLSGGIESVRDRVAVELPLFGEISPLGLGLPLFTLAIGLVDGFNPCAMWVLLFLLSLLTHVERRSRILMVAGTFVLISGLVYFAFMAAWLNIFLIIGYSRLIQVILATLAICVGIVHLKDFFALHRGLSLSIPESVKPTLYEHARLIVRAENLAAALAGVTVMAVLVNFVELLCTAGLPALYTQILTYYELSDVGYYTYLGLYNLAYIFDDGLVVAIAVLTLGRRKLQAREGRWLKLISGLVILSIGVVLVLAPGILVF
jgi:glutaredoxin